jgi:hypothetical protein
MSRTAARWSMVPKHSKIRGLEPFIMARLLVWPSGLLGPSPEPDQGEAVGFLGGLCSHRR